MLAEGSGLDDDLVFDLADPIDFAGQSFSDIHLGAVLREAIEHDITVHGLYGDACGIDV